MSYHPKLSELINVALTRLDRSPSWLAQRLNVNPSTVSRWLNHGMRPSDPETVVRIADILGMSEQIQVLLKAAGFGYTEPTVPIVDITLAATPINSEPLPSATAAPLPVSALSAARLPAQATPFVGRNTEKVAILELFAQPGCRLITIAGAGGIGKTRLSLAVAEMAASRFTDGVYFVPLANIETPEAMLSAIAAGLELPDIGAVDVRQLLYNALRTKNLLLVLDNLEHLLDGANYLADLLQQAPHLTVLVTSQERLNLVEEWLYQLEGLSYPPAESSTIDAEYEAVTLFVQCARKSQLDFALEPEWIHVASICRLVEGLPFGIELAANWVRVMSCAEIAAQIAQDTDFLISPLRNLPTRHRSLRALFERSWQLLTPEEQVVLCQLSIFRNGFDRQAAETVVGATLPMLGALVNKSLIWRQPTGRFDMHGLLHQFASGKLADVPQLHAQVCARHAEFYADLAARAGWELEPGEDSAKNAFLVESFNLLAAWRWATETRNEAVIRHMVKPLANYYDYVGWQEETRHAFDATVRAFDATAPTIEVTGLLGSLFLRVAKAYSPYRVQERYTMLSKAVGLLEHASPQDDLDLTLAYIEFAMANASLGHNQAALDLLEKALTIVRSAGSALGEGHSQLRLGLLKLGCGRAQEATGHLETAIDLLDGVDADAVMRCTHLLGGVLIMRGFYPRAEALLQQALTYAVINRRNLRAGYIERDLAQLKTFTGNFPEAMRYYQGSYARLEPLNLRIEVMMGMLSSPGVLARLHGAPDAEQQLVDAVATMRQIGYQQRLATALHHLSRFRHDQRDYEGALVLLDEALAIARQIDFRYATSLILTQQGHSYVAIGQPDTARRCYAEALQIARNEALDGIALDALCGVAGLLKQAGNEEWATTFLRLVYDYPASDYETRQRAKAYLSRINQAATVARTEEDHKVETAFDLTEATKIALQWLR